MKAFSTIRFVLSSSWFSWKIAFVEQQLLESKDMYKCKPPGRLLTVSLGLYKLKSMLEWYQCFISGNTICFELFLVFLENCIYVTSAVEITGLAQMLTP